MYSEINRSLVAACTGAPGATTTSGAANSAVTSADRRTRAGLVSADRIMWVPDCVQEMRFSRGTKSDMVNSGSTRHRGSVNRPPTRCPFETLPRFASRLDKPLFPTCFVGIHCYCSRGSRRGHPHVTTRSNFSTQEITMAVRLGDTAPDFTAPTTQGDDQLPRLARRLVGRAVLPPRRTSRRSAPPSSATWPRSSPSSTSAT